MAAAPKSGSNPVQNRSSAPTTTTLPALISCIGPLIAGTLIVSLGGYSSAAPLIGLFFILGVVAAPFLPETKGKPLPHALWREGPAPSPGS